MKFAKELDRDCVPEWRFKYLNYKLGKKKLKAINRALRNVNQTPRLLRRGTSVFTPSPFDTAPKYSFLNRSYTGHDHSNTREHGDLRALAIGNSSLKGKPNGSQASPAHNGRNPEEEPLNGGDAPEFPGMTRYGSIIGSPPTRDSLERSRPPPSLKLPGAALDPDKASPQVGPSGAHKKAKSVQLPQEEEGDGDNAYQIGHIKSPPRKTALPSRYRSVFSPKRVNSNPGSPVVHHPRPLLKRVFSMSHKTPPPSPGDVPLEAYRELDLRQAEFFTFLDMELEKVEAFYKQKEVEATERLKVLREQLHIMRDRRLDELVARQAAKIKAKARKSHDVNGGLLSGQHSSSEEERPQSNGKSINKSWLDPIDSALEAVQAGKYGKSTKWMQDLATPLALKPQQPDDHRDYARRPELSNVSYQSARRKLKVALQEYYRGLELLTSYARLNRTAFRKINKKYDKTVNARPSMRYMTEKVNKAWFVNSDVIEGHIRAVEDLYARYFEKGNHKVAVGKLRIKTARAGDYTENSFRNGLTLAAGAIFGALGLVQAYGLLYSDGDDDDDDDLSTNTSYLLQIYAGYFLMNFLFLLFCLACRVWHDSKINYVFVFEYDTRHHLDWRQLSELPSFFLGVLGLFMWLNFNRYGSEELYLYYPVILIGLSALVIFNPFKVMYYRSRMWLIYSMWRLICAGFYRVEWRDFYMGDMFCSLTYSMGNIALFFCLYSRGWDEPAQCNSSHSRLLGFFSTLPGIWRALQCIKRYYDTRNVFPHLVNCGKYTATIVYYVTLSVYRIDKTTTNRALFITFAIFNSIYCSIWDIMMDWSLGEWDAEHRGLRKTLGYKKVWWYYSAMILDPILRFNWIFYAIIPLQLQHSAITSFAVALSEVFRRSVWTLFRVENEHCTNVARYRASRDVELPYDIPSSPEVDAQTEERGRREDEEQPPSLLPPNLRRTSTMPADTIHTGPEAATGTGADLQETSTRSSTRRRRAHSQSEEPSPLARGLTRVGTLMRDAHAQDFERRRRPELGATSTTAGRVIDDESDDDDDDWKAGSGSGSRSDPAEWDRRDEAEIQQVREEVAIGRGEASNGNATPVGIGGRA